MPIENMFKMYWEGQVLQTGVDNSILQTGVEYNILYFVEVQNGILQTGVHNSMLNTGVENGKLLVNVIIQSIQMVNLH